MRFVGLLSGGKDSYYSLIKAIRQGHELVCLATLYSYEELDSSMFQSTGTLAVAGISQALGKPLVAAPLIGKSLSQELIYKSQEGDEIEDLCDLLTGVKYRFPQVEAVVSGAVLSNYQRLRIEDVCARLGLVSIAPLWRIDQTHLLQEQLDAGVEAVLVKVSSMGLTQQHVGKTIRELQGYFEELRQKFGFNVCGEGGEYETVVVDAPQFAHKLVFGDTQIISENKSDISCSAYMKIGKIDLEDKASGALTPVTLPSAALLFPTFFKSIGHFATGELTASAFGHSTCTSIEDEAYSLLQGAKRLLKMQGLSFSDVYYVHATLQSMGDFLKFNTVYKSFFNRAGPPARCCVETSGQASRVKIALQGSKYKQSALHVQSMTAWAPANVGPYSQAIELQGKLHMAGSIALDPSTMVLAKDQVGQCIANLRAVAGAMGYDIGNWEVVVVYYTEEKPVLLEEFDPFYIKVSRIPKDGNVEIELHLKKSLPTLRTQEVSLVGEGYQATLRSRFSADVLYMTAQVIIDSCSNPSALLAAVKSHLDAYFSSVPHKSPTKEEELMSSVRPSKSIVDYITEMRVVGPEAHTYKQSWVTEVPVMCVHSEKAGILICVEDILQANTFEYMQGGS